MFRRFNLLPRQAMLDGVTFKLRLRKMPGRRHRGGTCRDVTIMKLGKCRGRHISRLSKNVRRHIKLTHTLTGSPRILLVSRTFSTLSPLVHRRVRSRLLSLRRGVGHAVIFVARSLSRTVGLNSHVTVVGSNRIMRIKAPRRVLASPTGSCIAHFARDISHKHIIATSSVVLARPVIIHVHGSNPRTVVHGVERGHLCTLPIVKASRRFLNRVQLGSILQLHGRKTQSVDSVIVGRIPSMLRDVAIRSVLPLLPGIRRTLPIISRGGHLGNIMSASTVVVRVAKGSRGRVRRVVRGTVSL